MGRRRRPYRDAPYNEYDASACGGYFGARAPKCAYSLYFFLTHLKKKLSLIINRDTFLLYIHIIHTHNNNRIRVNLGVTYEHFPIYNRIPHMSPISTLGIFPYTRSSRGNLHHDTLPPYTPHYSTQSRVRVPMGYSPYMLLCNSVYAFT